MRDADGEFLINGSGGSVLNGPRGSTGIKEGCESGPLRGDRHGYML